VRAHGSPWASPFRLDQAEGRLIVQTLRPYRLRVLLRSGVDEGQRCVAAGPGAVAVALLLAELVGPGGEVLGLDPSGEDVRAGHAMAAASEWQNVELESVPLDATGGFRVPQLPCDLLYTVNILAVSTDVAGVAESLAASVAPGGQVVMEEQDLDETAAGAMSPALRRWQQLRGELARRRGNADGAARAPTLLLDHGFDIVEVDAAQPAFVQGVGRHLPNAELERSRSALVDAGLLGEAGVEELAQTLARETSGPGQLVLWPRVVFVRARRAALEASGSGFAAEAKAPL
jgi:SAM-dependent methyltransferase